MVSHGLLRVPLRIDSQLRCAVPTPYSHLLHPLPLVLEASPVLQVSRVLRPAQPHGANTLPPLRDLPVRGKHLLPLGTHHNR